MRLARLLPLFALMLVPGRFVCCQRAADMRVNDLAIPLCELLKKPLEFSGKTVTTTARIMRGRHVTGIWDPACPNRGADLHTQDSDHSTPAILELDKVLNKHGMGDHPVIATLTGTWLPNQTTKNGFLQQPRLVFLVSDASNIQRSKKVELR